uniref:MHD1 domain-containing protein n=4 Tax=Zea mays TaxID=4577 RepID=A0A804LYU0_MAIZE
MRATEIRAIDTSKNSDVMRALSNAVHALSWRSGTTGAAVEACHWADGYPLNVLLYCSLLQAIFDLRESTVVLDEVDELLELIKKTWPTLGINRMLHSVCLSWVFFQQYVITGQVEPDLAAAALAILVDVAADTKHGSRDPMYVKVLLSALGGMQEWSEKRLLDYHDSFEKDIGGAATEGMEILLSLALAAGKIVADREGASDGNFAVDRVDYYVRCSMKSAFTNILENGLGEVDSVIIDRDSDPGSVLIQLARDTEHLALFERRNFSPVLRRWHPAPVAVAAVTLHGCFGVVLRQYLAKVTILTEELVRVLHSASRLEKALAQMTAEDAADCADGRAKGIVGDMEPFEVESVVMGLLKAWMDDKLGLGRDCLLRARDTESWIPKSKEEPFAGSAMELMKLARLTIDEFSEIPASAKDEVVQDLVDGLESIFQEYIFFVASCGSKQNYLPPLPPLTRCNQDSGFFRLWKKAALPTCQAPPDATPRGGGGSHHVPRPSISRGTQRLYVRLNTLHYVLTHLEALDSSLSSSTSHLDRARAAAQSSISAVAEVAAHRLIFLDSRHSLYQGLYARSVADARIRPALRLLKQNLSFLVSVLADRAQPVAVREVMRASFEAFLMVLLAGGNERSFVRADHATVEEDFRSLRRAFSTCGEGLVPEDVVAREAETAEAVVELMARSTDYLIDAFSVATCDSISEDGRAGAGGCTPLPPTTRRWDPADPNTILRVLCHRDDEAANQFLKRTFQLARRR